MRLRLICYMMVAYTLMGMLEVPALAPKVMYVNSYHADYEWSAEIIQSVLDYYNITRNADGSLNCSQSPVELRLFHMDTKRNPEEEFAQAAALKARDDIEAWDPDVVIVADDNAFKYLVMPYYKNSVRPFVFCGVNWDVSHYDDAPYENTTGMIEVALFKPLIEHLRRYAAGTRVGFLSGDRYSDRAEAEYGRKFLHLDIEKAYYVSSFKEWKRAFRNLQTEVDLIIWTAIAGIDDWNEEEAQQLIREEAVVPFGSVNSWMMPYVLLGVTKSPEEQGEWAAQAALDIIAGKSPMEIPIATNKKAQIHLNMKIAKQMDIKFPLEWIKNAHLISAEQQKILFINSHHNAWSDGQEKGLLKALNIKENDDGTYDVSHSPVDFRVVRMNAKMNRMAPPPEWAVQSVLRMVQQWRPDLIVAADDCAAEYVVMQHLKQGDLPVVFCGVRCDASRYDFPAPLITGMVEVAPYVETVTLLRAFAGGERVGLIGGRFTACPKEVAFAKKVLQLKEKDIKLVSDFGSWKQAYLDLQQTEDMMVLLSPVGIEGWDPQAAIKFVMEHTSIPTGCTSDSDVQYALLGRVKIAEEQGWWAGKTALKILAGTSPSAIPITTNRQSCLYLNMKLAEKMGIHFPVDLLKEAVFVGEKATE